MITEMNIRAGGKIAPDFMLKLDDRDITQNFSHRLISLTMTDKRGLEADQLDILLDDSDGLLDLPARGQGCPYGWDGREPRSRRKGTLRLMRFISGARRIR
ncbi:Phage late control gene D protein (GPD) [Enterobacter sp. HK169]|nr:Phage late control gene D protein (GPD) [Enterobacter sp. HK169]